MVPILREKLADGADWEQAAGKREVGDGDGERANRKACNTIDDRFWTLFLAAISAGHMVPGSAPTLGCAGTRPRGPEVEKKSGWRPVEPLRVGRAPRENLTCKPI